MTIPKVCASGFLLCLVLFSSGCKKDNTPTNPADDQAPLISIQSPSNNVAVGDTLVILASVNSENRVAKVEFFVNDVNVSGSGIIHSPFSYTFIPQSAAIGDTMRIYAKVTDTRGHTRISQTVRVTYKWFRIIADGNEPGTRNIKSVYARSTSSTIDFRVESFGAWTDPHNGTSGLDCFIYLDVDRDRYTGLHLCLDGYGWNANDIGPDFVAKIGKQGDSLWIWNQPDSLLYPLDPFAVLNMPNDTNVFEMSIRLSDLGNPSRIDVVADMYVDSTHWDWAPNTGHVTYAVVPNYIGHPILPNQYSNPNKAHVQNYRRDGGLRRYQFRSN